MVFEGGCQNRNSSFPMIKKIGVRVGSTTGYRASDRNKKAIVVRWPAAMAYGTEAMASCSEQLRIFSNTSASKPPEGADSHRHSTYKWIRSACLVKKQGHIHGHSVIICR